MFDPKACYWFKKKKGKKKWTPNHSSQFLMHKKKNKRHKKMMNVNEVNDAKRLMTKKDINSQ